MSEDNPKQADPALIDQTASPMSDPATAAMPHVSTEQIASKPVVQKRSGGVMAILGGVVAAVIGFVLAQVVPNGWPLKNLAATDAQVAAQAQEIAALMTALQDAGPDVALTARVETLENAPGADLSTLDQRLSALETELAARPAGGSSIDPAALAGLRAEIDALKASGGPLPDAIAKMNRALDEKLAAAEKDTAAIVAKVEAAATAADQRSAVGQIRAALESGAPFVSAVTQLESLMVPDVLTAGAETGLPTLQSLQARFPDAARTALETAMRADMGESWTERVGAFLLTQTGARSLAPREGTDPDAVLSRAEAALRLGDLTAAVSELNALPDVALASMQGWLEQANLRLAAQDAVAALSATLEQ